MLIHRNKCLDHSQCMHFIITLPLILHDRFYLFKTRYTFRVGTRRKWSLQMKQLKISYVGTAKITLESRMPSGNSSINNWAASSHLCFLCGWSYSTASARRCGKMQLSHMFRSEILKVSWVATENTLNKQGKKKKGTQEMPTNWRKHGHISWPYEPAELSVPFCHLIPAFPKWSKSASKETAHQSAQKLHSPPFPNSAPPVLLPFIPAKGSYGHSSDPLLKSFSVSAATSSLLLQFLPLSTDLWGYFKALLIADGFLSHPFSLHWCLMFSHILATFLCCSFPFPKEITLLFPPHPKPYMLLFCLLIQLLLLSSTSQPNSDRFLHRALFASQLSPCPSALPAHTKRIRSSDCKGTQQKLQQQMLQQRRNTGC